MKSVVFLVVLLAMVLMATARPNKRVARSAAKEEEKEEVQRILINLLKKGLAAEAKPAAPKAKAACGASDKARFGAFQKKHAKNYASKEEEAHRFEVFKSNVKEIDAHNARHDNGDENYRLAVNHLTDLTNDEVRVRNGYKAHHHKVARRSAKGKHTAKHEAEKESIDFTESYTSYTEVYTETVTMEPDTDAPATHKPKPPGPEAPTNLPSGGGGGEPTASPGGGGSPGHLPSGGKKIYNSECYNGEWCCEYTPEATDAPTSLDWRDHGIVTPIKDQGQCGSCWTFATTGSIESQWAKTYGKNLSLSEQQLVSCATNEPNSGCNGGLAVDAYTYIIGAGGIESEKEYPYTESNWQNTIPRPPERGTCYAEKSEFVANLQGCATLPSQNEDALIQALATVGPIAVGIDASSSKFQSYSSGVFDLSTCSSTALDHAVLAVGYGTENGMDYWLIKNSWGTWWGDQGYIKIARKGNLCGVATSPTFPIVG